MIVSCIRHSYKLSRVDLAYRAADAGGTQGDTSYAAARATFADKGTLRISDNFGCDRAPAAGYHPSARLRRRHSCFVRRNCPRVRFDVVVTRLDPGRKIAGSIFFGSGLVKSLDLELATRG
jgi:hypothetical protein